MIVVHVTVTTKDHTASDFERIIREIQRDVLKMPGCVKNEWYRVPDAALRYVMYGEFASQEAFTAYLNSPMVQRIGAELMPLLAAPPEFKHFEARVFEASEA